MIQIKNIVGVDVEINFDSTSEVIPSGTLIDVNALNSCQSKQGVAKIISLILSDNFEVYVDSVKKNHNVMTVYYHTNFNL